MRLKIFVFIPLYCVWVLVALVLAFGLLTAGVRSLDDVLLPGIVLYTVLIMIPIWLFVKWINASPGWAKKVEAEGKQAPATIVSVKDTGMIINRTIMVVKVQLRVEPPGEEPFEVTQEKEISMLYGLGGLVAGARLQVKYDPDNKKHVIILEDAVAAPSYPAASSRSSTAPEVASNRGTDFLRNLQELSDLHQKGELSDAEFEAAKKKLFT